MGATSHLPSRKLNLGSWSALSLLGPVAALMLAVALPGSRVRGTHLSMVETSHMDPHGLPMAIANLVQMKSLVTGHS